MKITLTVSDSLPRHSKYDFTFVIHDNRDITTNFFITNNSISTLPFNRILHSLFTTYSRKSRLKTNIVRLSTKIRLLIPESVIFSNRFTFIRSPFLKSSPYIEPSKCLCLTYIWLYDPQKSPLASQISPRRCSECILQIYNLSYIDQGFIRQGRISYRSVELNGKHTLRRFFASGSLFC